jgi:hypothetical protein
MSYITPKQHCLCFLEISSSHCSVYSSSGDVKSYGVIFLYKIIIIMAFAFYHLMAYIWFMVFNNSLFVDLNFRWFKGPSWSWSYGSWMYNYLCNQCLSQITLWVRIPLRRGVLHTRYNETEEQSRMDNLETQVTLDKTMKT